MAKSIFTGISDSYIFEGAGGMRDQLEQTILTEMEVKHYPLKATVSTLKASGKGLLGMVTGTKEQCVVIQVDNDAQIAISNTSVGSYLYVEVYLMIQEKTGLFANLAAMTDNVFKQQKRNAYYAAAKEATESAFVKLGLKQCNNGYKSSRREIKNED